MLPLRSQGALPAQHNSRSAARPPFENDGDRPRASALKKYNIRDHPTPTFAKSTLLAGAVTQHKDTTILTPDGQMREILVSVPCQEEKHETGSVKPAERPVPRMVADASLVARGALKSGYLWKLGANIPRWKRRFFVLKPITMLFYYMSEYDTEPRGCIDLDLFNAVRKVSGTRGSRNAADSSAESRRKDDTAFELYRSGSPDGSGFMLEARGAENWEHWVESIANGRHGKMQGEMDVLKGTNKLLLEEISGLEQQVVTFRGYADQRHVTVLALRDERQRNREVSTELHALADTSSAVSHLISAGLETEERQQRNDAQEEPLGRSRGWGPGGPALVPSTPAYRYSHRNENRAPQDTTIPDDAPGAPAALRLSDGVAAAGGGAAMSTASEDQLQVAQERLCLESIRKALADARIELERRGKAMEEEREARKAAEGRVADADKAVLVAGERAVAAGVAAGRFKGRVSVLERNVDYLMSQQRGLRAELCQAQHKAQLVRAQRAVLKKEVRDMWSRQSSTSIRFPATCAAQQGSTRSRGRTWASMGDLSGADAAVPRRRAATSTSTGSCPDVSEIAAAAPGGGGGMGMKSCMSGENFMASDGGDTDYADQTASEASDEEDDENRGNAASRRGSSQEPGNIFRQRVGRIIRKRVGDPHVPPLPPSRHLRILEAAKHASSKNVPTTADAGLGPGVSATPPFVPGLHGAGGATGMGMAGILLGLRKGMVDKAAQEMGKKLGLWQEGASVGSLASLTAAATGPQTPVTSPRSSTAANAAALTDSPVRWGSSHGSASDADEGAAANVAAVPTFVGHPSSPYTPSGVAAGVASDDAKSAAGVGGAGGRLPRVSSVGSRTALIQLSDLELAEPCRTRVNAVMSTGGESRRRERQSGVARRRLSALPPRPDDQYELLFTSQVIGLRFGQLDGERGGVFVQERRSCYVGPTPTGVPGEKLFPEVGDILESYNGVSAHGKSADVVARELAGCGRPLRLGFCAPPVLMPQEEEELEEEEGWCVKPHSQAAVATRGNSDCRDFPANESDVGGAWVSGSLPLSVGGSESSCRGASAAVIQPGGTHLRAVPS